MIDIFGFVFCYCFFNQKKKIIKHHKLPTATPCPTCPPSTEDEARAAKHLEEESVPSPNGWTPIPQSYSGLHDNLNNLIQEVRDLYDMKSFKMFVKFFPINPVPPVNRIFFTKLDFRDTCCNLISHKI